MRNVIKILFLAGSLLMAKQTLVAQNQSDMRLNEVLVVNLDDFMDDYGHRHAWIELFNKSYGTVNISGCFLTNDRNDLKKYPIPKGDILTKIPPRQHILFWADNKPKRGTFHLSFTLDSLGENTIYFVNSDGRTIVDSVVVPANMPANVSYGRLDDGVGEWAILNHTTPSSNNVILDKEAASQRMAQNDPYGIIMSITAMSVVFAALIILYRIFKRIGISALRLGKKNADEVKQKKVKKGSAAVVANPEAVSGEIFAAIAAAVHLYITQEEAHDVENTILTINKVARSYSPWSSKIYGLRVMPDKK